MVQAITVELVLYAMCVALLQTGAIIWLVHPYVIYKREKRYAVGLLFFLFAIQDFLYGIWSTAEKNYVLFGIGAVCFYLLMVLLLRYYFKGNVYYNFIYLFAMDCSFQIVGMLLSFPIVMIASGFDIEKAEQIANETDVRVLLIFTITYVINAWINSGIWKILFKNKGLKFHFFCLIFCLLDIISLMISGWESLVVIFPVICILIGVLYLTQNHSEKIMKDQYAYYQALEEVQREKVKEISEIRHDIANHLSVMEEMSKDKQGRDILQKIDRGYGVITGVPVLDCLIGEKEKQCFGKEITFQVKSGLLGEISISEFDLISLFANLLDNAIEAAEKADEKSVDLSIEKQQGCIKIVLSNSKAKEEEPVESKFATTKRDKQNHGIGTRIIKKIVSDNDGRITYEDQGSKMKVTVIIGG